MEYERDEYDRFLASGRLDRPANDWQRMITRHTNAGRSLQRVHVVVEPLSDYLRYEVAAYQLNGQAGEDIRLIPVSPNSWPAGLPTGRDFWLFDDREVWDMHYDTAGRFLRATRSESPQYLDQCRQWRDIALNQAITLADYLRMPPRTTSTERNDSAGLSPPSPRCAHRPSPVGSPRRQLHR